MLFECRFFSASRSDNTTRNFFKGKMKRGTQISRNEHASSPWASIHKNEYPPSPNPSPKIRRPRSLRIKQVSRMENQSEKSIPPEPPPMLLNEPRALLLCQPPINPFSTTPIDLPQNPRFFPTKKNRHDPEDFFDRNNFFQKI